MSATIASNSSSASRLRFGVPLVPIRSRMTYDYESAAMWRLYAANSAAVAIRSTVGRLRAAMRAPMPPPGFGGSDYVFIGMIESLDYTKDRIPDGSFAAQFFRK